MKKRTSKVIQYSNLALLFLVVTITSSILASNDAYADLRLCNKTQSKISVAIGYKTESGWRTEGWWNFNPREDRNACKILRPGQLESRFYYVYALDVTHGGEWGGDAILCTRQKEFTIDGVKNCIPRGFEKTGFFEVDTKNQASWTIELEDPEQEGQ